MFELAIIFNFKILFFFLTAMSKKTFNNNKLFNIDPVKSIIRSVRRHTNANGQYIAKNRLQGQIYNAIKELLNTTLYNEELPSVMELRKLIENKTAEITQSLQS